MRLSVADTMLSDAQIPLQAACCTSSGTGPALVDAGAETEHDVREALYVLADIERDSRKFPPGKWNSPETPTCAFRTAEPTSSLLPGMVLLTTYSNRWIEAV
jgi:hypothetical protein